MSENSPVPEKIVLDIRLVSLAFFGGVDSLVPGQTLEFISPHEPKPLLAQLAQRNPGQFDVTVDEADPETTHVYITKK